MTEIGTPAEAAAAYGIVYDGAPSEGWKVIGRGCSRIALLGPSGVVYKVPYDSTAEASGVQNNRVEALRLGRWAGRSFAPRATLYEVPGEWGDLIPVLAMEHVVADGTEATNMDEMLQALIEVQAIDLNSGNWVVRQGRAIVIDAAGV